MDQPTHAYFVKAVRQLLASIDALQAQEMLSWFQAFDTALRLDSLEKREEAFRDFVSRLKAFDLTKSQIEHKQLSIPQRYDFQDLKEHAVSELSHLLEKSVDEVTTIITRLLARLKEFNAMEVPRAFIKEASKRPQGAFPISALYTEGSSCSLGTAGAYSEPTRTLYLQSNGDLFLRKEVMSPKDKRTVAFSSNPTVPANQAYVVRFDLVNNTSEDQTLTFDIDVTSDGYYSYIRVWQEDKYYSLFSKKYVSSTSTSTDGSGTGTNPAPQPTTPWTRL